MKFWVNKLSVRLSAAALAVLGLYASSADAGEVLRLKAGEVNTREESLRSGLGAPQGGRGYFVIQFKEPIHRKDSQALKDLGAKIVRYLPDDALVVKANLRTIETIRSTLNDHINAVVRYSPLWKQSLEFVPASVFSAQFREDVLVTLFPDEKVEPVVRALRAIRGTLVLETGDRSIRVSAERRSVEEIAKIEAVEWVQPNPVIDALYMKGLVDPEHLETQVRQGYEDATGFETGTKIMNFETAWARGLTGHGQIAAMADTGLDVGDLSKLHQDFYGRVPSGYAFGLFSRSWEDPMGHGTHVAGSVVGGGNASGGIFRGGAYEAWLVAESLWSPMLNNLTLPSRMEDLFGRAYNDGARVHTNSWGAAASTDYDAMAQKVDEIAATYPDLLILFAAGNAGADRNRDGRVDPGSVGSPGTAKNVLTVGASKNYVLKGGLQAKLKETNLKDLWPVEPLASSSFSENPQGLVAFSSRGPTPDGRIKPEVVAPGTNILSVRSQHPKAEILWGAYNQDYVWSGGTSMSTPLVAGAATVVRQYLVEQRGVARPSAALIKAILMHTAVDLYPGGFGEIGAANGQEILKPRPDSDQGYGRVDVARATDLDGAFIVDEPVGVGTGQSQTYVIRVSGFGRLTATLVYTDVPGAAGASKALVNDLDLVLIYPDGREVSLSDRLNNAEMIEADVVPGDYKIRIKGHNVPQGPVAGSQPYALVVTVN